MNTSEQYVRLLALSQTTAWTTVLFAHTHTRRPSTVSTITELERQNQKLKKGEFIPLRSPQTSRINECVHTKVTKGREQRARHPFRTRTHRWLPTTPATRTLTVDLNLPGTVRRTTQHPAYHPLSTTACHLLSPVFCHHLKIILCHCHSLPSSSTTTGPPPATPSLQPPVIPTLSLLPPANPTLPPLPPFYLLLMLFMNLAKHFSVFLERKGKDNEHSKKSSRNVCDLEIVSLIQTL